MGGDLVWTRSNSAVAGRQASIGAPVATAEARRLRFDVRFESESGQTSTYELLPAQAETWRLPVGGESRVTVSSDCAEVTMLWGPRPSWASRMGHDRHGLYADLELAEGVELRLRWIPPGRFSMGSPEDEAGRVDREGPRHEVTISSGFWLGATPVTQARWQAVMRDNPSHFQKLDSPDRPVENVSYQQTRDFCAELAERFPELVFDLPGEAEWEYACRAGTTSAFNDGSACTEPDGKDGALEALGCVRGQKVWGKSSKP